MHGLIVTYGVNPLDRIQHAEFVSEIAPALAAVLGLVSRTPLENESTGRFGAFSLFESKEAFDRFVASELYAAIGSHRTVKALQASEFSVHPRREPVARRRAAVAGGGCA